MTAAEIAQVGVVGGDARTLAGDVDVRRSGTEVEDGAAAVARADAVAPAWIPIE